MQNKEEIGAPLTGGPVDHSVRPVEDELRELAYERAGGFASGDDGRYDPQLLDVMIRGADEIERQTMVIAEAKKIIEELCACYGHPTPDATLERMTPN